MSTAIIAGAAAGGAALLLIGIGSLFMGSSDVKPRQALTEYRNTGDWGDKGTFGQGISSKKHKHKKGSTKRRKSSGKGSKKK